MLKLQFGCAVLLFGQVLFSQPASSADAALGKKPGETFKDCEDCQVMVVVPAGSFLMGSTPGEREHEGVPPNFGEHEQPQVEITISRPFAIAQTETTVEQWSRFVSATHRPIPESCADYDPEHDSWAGTPGKKVNWQSPGFAQTANHPVACISFQDAVDYAAWLAKTTGHKYRLPSEAEWEYVARAGTGTVRPWGNSAASICSRARIMTSGTYAAINHSKGWTRELLCADDSRYTVPVASYQENPWHVYDMLGNVWEWVIDCAAPDHWRLPRDGSAQTASNGGNCERRIGKGGAFHSRVWLARPATRGEGLSGTARALGSGIRVVRELD